MGYWDMDQPDKIDCRTNGEVILRATSPLHLKGPKNLSTGSSAKPNGSRSPISTKNGIDWILPMRLVYNVKKIVRKLLQGKVILPERYGKWIEG